MCRVYSIFDNQFYIRKDSQENPTRWRWEADAYPYGIHFSPWYNMDVEPTLELFGKFVADSVGFDQT
jgi:hypothetical protein